tara:strand:- start:11089 stop:11505 length:417 start_codon:yes stop_codon:yes gene_type:complete
MNPSVTIRFPAPLPAEVPCPICSRIGDTRGTGCLVCDRSGKILITVDAKVPIQRGLIVKYVAENMDSMGALLTQQYGLSPDVETEEVLDVGEGQYEIVRISSLGGVVWIANRLDELESPRYFKTLKALKNFRGGWIEE